MSGLIQLTVYLGQQGQVPAASLATDASAAGNDLRAVATRCSAFAVATRVRGVRRSGGID
ncbi:MAG: hypothetical protein M3O70_11580 [Actinomycetota bacterium]|nr:hypothetical protein [Actinomycetota bacterium]